MTKAWRTVLLLVFLSLIIPGIVWLIITQTLGVVSIVALVVIALVGGTYLAATKRSHFWAWALGVLAVLVTPALLSLGGALGGEARPVFYHWIYVYCAGLVGGLVLELLIGKGRLELPSVVAADPVPPTSDTRPIAGGQDGADQDLFAPYGPRFDIGFFARLTLGGVAAAAFVVLIHAATKKTDIQTLSQAAKHFDTLGLAAIIGAVAITVWKSAEAIATARLAPLLAHADAADSTLEKVRDTLAPEAAAPATAEVDRVQASALATWNVLASPEFHAALAAEGSRNGVVRILEDNVPLPDRTDLESARARSLGHHEAVVTSLALVDAARASLARARRLPR